MERVETLLQKLQQQFNSGVPVKDLLQTVQMLQHELTHVQAGQPGTAKESVLVSMPLQHIEVVAPDVAQKEKAPVAAEKIIQVLQVDEDEVAAELEEMKRNAG